MNNFSELHWNGMIEFQQQQARPAKTGGPRYCSNSSENALLSLPQIRIKVQRQPVSLILGLLARHSLPAEPTSFTANSLKKSHEIFP
jgi:hypothetical protein